MCDAIVTHQWHADEDVGQEDFGSNESPFNIKSITVISLLNEMQHLLLFHYRGIVFCCSLTS